MNIESLNDTLDKANVSSRSKGGTNLSYIEGWWAISEANRIFGFDGWDRVTEYCREVSRTEYDKNGKPMHKVGYEAKVKIVVNHEGKLIVRDGTGHGSQNSSDLFDAIEGAAKEAETDAMKRALMTFGNPLGLALYDKQQRFVEDHKHRFAAGEKDSIYAGVMLTLENGDENGLKEILDEYSTLEEKSKVWGLFNSTERASIKALLKDD